MKAKTHKNADAAISPFEFGFSLVPLLFVAWTAQTFFAAGGAGGEDRLARDPSSAEIFDSSVYLIGETAVGFDAP